MQLIAPLKTANVPETFDNKLDETEINSDHRNRKDKRKFFDQGAGGSNKYVSD